MQMVKAGVADGDGETGVASEAEGGVEAVFKVEVGAEVGVEVGAVVEAVVGAVVRKEEMKGPRHRVVTSLRNKSDNT